MGKKSQYCKAYLLEDLRLCEDWATLVSSEESQLESETVVYLHDDYHVTQGINPDDNIIFDEVTSEWKQYCRERLNFDVAN